MSARITETPHINPFQTVLFGLKKTTQGIFDITTGKVMEGAKKIFCGFIATNVTARYVGLSDFPRKMLLKYPLQIGSGLALVQGLEESYDGLVNKNRNKTSQAIAQISIAILGLVSIDSLSTEQLEDVHLGLLIVFVLFYTIKASIDIIKTKTKPINIVLSSFLLIYIAFCLYNNEFIRNEYIPDERTLTPNELEFLTENIHSIDWMHTNEKPAQGWFLEGLGMCKNAYSHPRIADWVIKLPQRTVGHRNPKQTDVITDYENIIKTKEAVGLFKLDKIKIPSSFLMPYSYGHYLVQEFISTRSLEGNLLNEPMLQDPIAQLDSLKELTGLCDLYPQGNHNTGIFSLDGKNPKMGIFDFDCMAPPKIKLHIITLWFLASATVAYLEHAIKKRIMTVEKLCTSI